MVALFKSLTCGCFEIHVFTIWFIDVRNLDNFGAIVLKTLVTLGVYFNMQFLILKDLTHWHLECSSIFHIVMSKRMLQIKFMITCSEIAPRWVPQNTIDDKSASVQIIA